MAAAFFNADAMGRKTSCTNNGLPLTVPSNAATAILVPGAGIAAAWIMGGRGECPLAAVALCGESNGASGITVSYAELVTEDLCIGLPGRINAVTGIVDDDGGGDDAADGDSADGRCMGM